MVSGGLACVVGAGLIALLMPVFRRHDAEEFGEEFGDTLV